MKVDISSFSQMIIYIDLTIIGILSILLLIWQIQVYRGRSMKNPDGTYDNWHEQKIYYGMAISDLVIAIPLTLLGITLIFLDYKLGYYITGMTSFWFVWINSAFTITSIRFAKPKITFMWIIVFPFGAIVGAVYLIWSLYYFKEIFIN